MENFSFILMMEAVRGGNNLIVNQSTIEIEEKPKILLNYKEIIVFEFKLS